MFFPYLQPPIRNSMQSPPNAFPYHKPSSHHSYNLIPDPTPLHTPFLSIFMKHPFNLLRHSIRYPPMSNYGFAQIPR